MKYRYGVYLTNRGCFIIFEPLSFTEMVAINKEIEGRIINSTMARSGKVFYATKFGAHDYLKDCDYLGEL